MMGAMALYALYNSGTWYRAIVNSPTEAAEAARWHPGLRYQIGSATHHGNVLENGYMAGGEPGQAALAGLYVGARSDDGGTVGPRGMRDGALDGNGMPNAAGNGMHAVGNQRGRGLHEAERDDDRSPYAWHRVPMPPAPAVVVLPPPSLPPPLLHMNDVHVATAQSGAATSVTAEPPLVH